MGDWGERHEPESTTKDITSWSSQKSAKESTGREDGYDERLVRGRDTIGTIAFIVTELLQPRLGNSESKVGWERGGWGGTYGHFFNTRNDTGVISKEDTVTMW